MHAMRILRTIPSMLLTAALMVSTFSLVSTAAAQEATPVAGALPPGVTVVASGLTNPRGFAWDADGALYLALAGTGGPNQVIADGTPYPFFGGKTSSIVRVEGGCTVPVADGLASFLWTEPRLDLGRDGRCLPRRATLRPARWWRS